jgi:hypothetical protein
MGVSRKLAVSQKVAISVVAQNGFGSNSAVAVADLWLPPVKLPSWTRSSRISTTWPPIE